MPRAKPEYEAVDAGPTREQMVSLGFITVAEAAELARCSTDRVFQVIAAGLVPGVKKLGKEATVPKWSWLKFLETRLEN